LRLRVRRWIRAHRRGTALLFGLFALLIAALVWLFVYLHSYESTDDAQVDGHIAPVGTRVNGTVLRVGVEDNQWVKAGDLLVELDPRDAQVALARAEAELARAEAQLAASHPQVPITTTTSQTRVTTSREDVSVARAALSASEREHESAIARVKEAEANHERATADLERYRFLLREKAIPPERWDEKLAQARATAATVDANRALARSAQKGVEEARERLNATESRLDEANRNAPLAVEVQRSTVSAGAAGVMSARAAVEQAKLDLDYTRVRAPIDGIIGRRSAEPGARVQPGQALLAIVDVRTLWVTANFKETQLGRMRPGQPADFRVDALGRKFRGVVESLGGATGSRYSLLPPENATGNYVKVVQRVPVRIRIDPGQRDADRLRPGMSVVPSVRLR
jgi:membrane fusion protein (multidrug efflux system)